MKKISLTLIFILTLKLNFAQEIKFGKISKEELEAKNYPTDSLADAAYLYKKERSALIFNSATGNFECRTSVHHRIKIYNEKGFDYASKVISLYAPSTKSNSERLSNLKAYTYNLIEGKIKKHKLSKKEIFSERKNKYWKTESFTLPEIKKGCIVEISYTIVSPNWDVDDISFEEAIPIKQLYCEAEIPEYFTFNKRNKGYYFITPKIEKKNRNITLPGAINPILATSTVYCYAAKNIPALSDNEPFISNIDNYRGGVSFEISSFTIPGSVYENYSNTWESVSKRIFKSDSFGTELNYHNYFKSDLAQFIKPEFSEIEKMMIVFEYAKSRVKWNGFIGKYVDKGVKRAYKEGSGSVADINLMLTSMLREVGLDANPVLLSTRSNGIPLFPTLEGYNYVIASVNFDGSYALLDATEPFSTPNNLPLRDLNWNGRVVYKDGRSKSINLVPKKHSEITNSLTYSLTPQGAVKGMLRTKMTGIQAMDYRKKYSLISKEDMQLKLENKYHVEIQNFRQSNLDIPSKPFSELIQFSSEDLTEVINGKIYLDPLLFFTMNVNPFKLEKRKYPVDYGSPWKEKNMITIQIPEGYKIESMPETVGIGLPDNIGTYKYVLKQQGNKINIISEEVINKAIVAPKYYQSLKGLYNEMVQNQKKKIVLSKI